MFLRVSICTRLLAFLGECCCMLIHLQYLYPRSYDWAHTKIIIQKLKWNKRFTIYVGNNKLIRKYKFRFQFNSINIVLKTERRKLFDNIFHLENPSLEQMYNNSFLILFLYEINDTETWLVDSHLVPSSTSRIWLGKMIT